MCCALWRNLPIRNIWRLTELTAPLMFLFLWLGNSAWDLFLTHNTWQLNTFLPRTFFHNSHPEKFAWKTDILRNRSIGCPWMRIIPSNTLIYSHGLLYNIASYKHLFWFKLQFRVVLRYIHNYFTLSMSDIKNRNKMQLIQINWNAMLYSQRKQFAFYWKLLV